MGLSATGEKFTPEEETKPDASPEIHSILSVLCARNIDRGREQTSPQEQAKEDQNPGDDNLVPSAHDPPRNIFARDCRIS